MTLDKNEVKDRLNLFADWHTSCNGGNVSEEAQTCLDAVKVIESLEKSLLEEHSAYMLAHGIFKNERGQFRKTLERCMAIARSWDTCDMTLATQVCARDIEQQIGKIYDFEFPRLIEEN